MFLKTSSQFLYLSLCIWSHSSQMGTCWKTPPHTGPRSNTAVEDSWFSSGLLCICTFFCVEDPPPPQVALPTNSGGLRLGMEATSEKQGEHRVKSSKCWWQQQQWAPPPRRQQQWFWEAVRRCPWARSFDRRAYCHDWSTALWELPGAAFRFSWRVSHLLRTFSLWVLSVEIN